MNTKAAFAAGAVVLLILGICAGAWVHSSFGPSRTGAAPPERELKELTAGPLPQRKIPDRLPEFSLDGSDGKRTSIHAFDGKSLIINFWATWCAPCRQEIPLLQAVNAEWGPRGVAVIGIAVDNRDKVLEFARQLDIRYPLLIGEQDALDLAGAFGVDSPVFPFTVFTDRSGAIVAVMLGELKRPQVDLILSVVERLNKKALDLRTAKIAIADGLDSL